MNATRRCLRYHATEAVASSTAIRVVVPDGRLHARLDRRVTGTGRTRWDWRGGGLNDFSIEVEPGGAFLLTGPVGIPFGRIRYRGTLQPRLTAQDAERARFVIDLDGRIRSCHGLHRGLGHITAVSPMELAVGIDVTTDETLTTLLVAAPLCLAVTSSQADRS